jgi:hypothetical protein
MRVLRTKNRNEAREKKRSTYDFLGRVDVLAAERLGAGGQPAEGGGRGDLEVAANVLGDELVKLALQGAPVADVRDLHGPRVGRVGNVAEQPASGDGLSAARLDGVGLGANHLLDASELVDGFGGVRGVDAGRDAHGQSAHHVLEEGVVDVVRQQASRGAQLVPHGQRQVLVLRRLERAGHGRRRQLRGRARAALQHRRHHARHVLAALGLLLRLLDQPPQVLVRVPVQRRQPRRLLVVRERRGPLRHQAAARPCDARPALDRSNVRHLPSAPAASPLVLIQGILLLLQGAASPPAARRLPLARLALGRLAALPPPPPVLLLVLVLVVRLVLLPLLLLLHPDPPVVQALVVRRRRTRTLRAAHALTHT